MDTPTIDRGKLLFRAIHAEDSSAIYQIAMKVGPGFTSLPKDENAIKRKIKRSLESCRQEGTHESGLFFFVLEDIIDEKIIGTSAIEACASYESPFYNYEVATIVQKSTAFNKEKHHTVLFLENNYQDASVLGALYLDPIYRGLKRGEFLSRARCLFIAEFPHLFSEIVISEMRGLFDQAGNSPFWEGLGSHFFDMDFNTANKIRSTEGSQIITDLMPIHPIYSELLSQEAQDAIAKTHANTAAAKHVLEKEGFSYRRYIDIFDAGPILETEKKSIKSVQESKRAIIVACQEGVQGSFAMISNVSLDFKATLGDVLISKESEVIISIEAAALLQVGVGDWVRFMPL